MYSSFTSDFADCPVLRNIALFIDFSEPAVSPALNEVAEFVIPNFSASGGEASIS